MDFKEIMKMAQDVQLKLKAGQEELANKTVSAESGGGMVSVVINGRQELRELKIDPLCVDRRDIPMLQDLIIAAVNVGVRKSREMASDEMKKITGGLPLPFDIL